MSAKINADGAANAPAATNAEATRRVERLGRRVETWRFINVLLKCVKVEGDLSNVGRIGRRTSDKSRGVKLKRNLGGGIRAVV